MYETLSELLTPNLFATSVREASGDFHYVIALIGADLYFVHALCIRYLRIHHPYKTEVKTIIRIDGGFYLH